MQYENKGRYIVRFKDIPAPRQHHIEIDVDERRNNYREVELGFDQERALKEAERCLSCRRCLGCALCWAECKPEAIRFELEDEIIEVEADAVIISPGVERALDRIDKRFGLEKDSNVITDLQLERMLSDSGPSAGLVIRPYDGEIPMSVAFVQAFDNAAPGMMRAALTFAVNEAVMLRRKLPEAEIVMYASGLEEFSEGLAALPAAGVVTRQTTVKSVAPDAGRVTVTSPETQNDNVEEFDLVVLITQPQISKDVRDLSRSLGLSLSYVDFLAGDGKGYIATDKDAVQLTPEV